MRVERVDCRKKGAPKWCRKVNYATSGEKKGTLAVVLRSGVAGVPHTCMGDQYISEVPDSGVVPKSVLEELDAMAVTLEPRDSSGSDRYFVVPDGVKPKGLKWMKPCPLGKAQDPCPNNDCIKNTLGVACIKRGDVSEAVKMVMAGKGPTLPGCKWMGVRQEIKIVDIGPFSGTAEIIEVESGQRLHVVREAVEY